jgi:hypothetical protein
MGAFTPRPASAPLSPIPAADRALADPNASVAELRGLRDRLLAWIAEDKSRSFETGMRLARVKERIRDLERAAGTDSGKDWLRIFFEVAARLLDEPTMLLLKRETDLRRAESLPKGPPSSASPLPPSANALPAEPVKSQRLTVPVHCLVSAATNRPMKFDPTPLFREFGREKVLGLWNMLAPENRPETGHQFREMLRKGVA